MRYVTVDAILLDLDGVLVDSTAEVEAAWRSFARRHGLDVARVLALAHGRPSRAVVAAAAPALDAAAEAAAVEEEQRARAGRSRALPGAGALLRALPAGRWAIVTSGGERLARARLAGAGLPAPPVLLHADAIARGKPAPDGYLEAARQLGVAPRRCLVVEDAPAGVAAARAAGAAVVALATTHAPPELAGADAIVEDLTAVTARVGGAGGALDVRLTAPSARALSALPPARRG